MNKYRRPARWARVIGPDGSTRLAVGMLGQPPSPQARQLAASPLATALPPGCWHTSDHACGALARGPVEVVSATHTESGGKFRLLRQPGGPILSIEATDETAANLANAFWSDPTSWASRQDWRVEQSA